MTVLLVYPTHSNCREAEQPYLDAGVNVVTYPPRTTGTTPEHDQNCWNPEADIAENLGLPVMKTICPGCRHRERCAAHGYHRQLIAAREASVTLCTHKRLEFSGFTELTAGREYVSIHENPVDLLLPRSEASEADLVRVQGVLHRLLNDPRHLDWFGDDLCVDDEGHRYADAELAIRKQRLYEFGQHLATLVDQLVETVRSTEQTAPWQPPPGPRPPQGIERLLYYATRDAHAVFDGQPWRFLLTAAAGEFCSSAILVAERRVKGRGDTPDLRRTAIGFRRNRPSRHARTWFNDATLDADRLTTILGEPVQDCTPDGQIPLQKKAVQILRDLTRSSSPEVAASVVRGVLADRPHFRRVGLIGHRTHLPALQALGPGFSERIVKTTYFGSGEDRSSNAWHQQCDLIIVCGTPRVPPDTVAAYLIQVGEVTAACREPDWGLIRRDGQNEAGEPVAVSGRGYRDEAWRRACRDLVRASLVQAIGRGRGILETGCEVIVLSTEECGLLISDGSLENLSDSGTRVLEALRRLTMEISNNIYLENTIVTTDRIAQATGLSPVRVREVLRKLESRGLVRRVGQRRGWLPVSTDLDAADSTSQPGGEL